jgi:hypothetical protein
VRIGLPMTTMKLKDRMRATTTVMTPALATPTDTLALLQRAG